MAGSAQQGFTATAQRLVARLPGLVVLLTGMVMVSPVVHGFGAEAHRVVGHVAELYICTETRQALQQLMPDYSLAEAGVWADQIRSNPDWDIARPWHYINVPDGVALSEVPRRRSGDVLSAIDRFTAELRDTSLPQSQRAEALFFLVHFVGDVHQPLHVGRRDDLGGNKVDIEVNGQRTSLHYYWDSYVLDGVLRSPVGYGVRLAARNRGVAAGWQAADPLVWAIESQALRPEVYDFGDQSGAVAPGRIVLDGAYQARALEIIDLRLGQAGVRLAGVLNSIWCPGKLAD